MQPSQESPELSQRDGQSPAHMQGGHDPEQPCPQQLTPVGAGQVLTAAWPSRAGPSSQAHLDPEFLYRLQSCSLSLTTDPKKKPAKPVRRGKSRGTSRLPMEPHSPVGASTSTETHRWISASPLAWDRGPTHQENLNPAPAGAKLTLRGQELVGHVLGQHGGSQSHEEPEGKHLLEEALIRLKLCPSNLQRLWSVPQGAASAHSSAIWVSVGVMGSLGRTVHFGLGFISFFAKF